MSESKTPEMPLAEAQVKFPAPESEVVNTWRVCCDGGAAGLGHPRVWMTIPREWGWIDCGYCDKRFIHDSVAKDQAV